MTYKVLLINKEDAKDSMKCGLKYALEHKSEWKDSGVADAEAHFSTYDAARTFFVYDDIVYHISKDYIMPDLGTRLFILIDRDLISDRKEEKK